MKSLYVAIALLVSSIGLTQPSLATPSTTEEMRFRVLLDDKEIGYHTFTIARQGDAKVVNIKAEFDVRLFFIRAYNYLHENVETWQDGCLRRIESLTNDNGQRFEVNGEKTSSTFEIVTLDTSRSLKQDCVMTFAYWDRDFLIQPRLLNAQTGDYIEVTTESLGKRHFKLGDDVTFAHGFHVFSNNHDLSIKVWYEENSGRWLALESAVGNGKTLRYIPVKMEGTFS
ncbi:MAG: DUF6134 family protein [Arenicellales bacterium]|nr:DUF6134 family protein [Arenicellales bacterium]